MTASVYFIQRGDSGPIKIGFSHNPKARLAALKTGSDQPLRIIGILPGDKQAERRLHIQFAGVRLAGEWFSPSPELVAFVGTLRPADDAPICEADPVREGVERLKKRFPDDAAGFLKYLKENLPASAFNAVVDAAANSMADHSRQKFIAFAEAQ